MTTFLTLASEMRQTVMRSLGIESLCRLALVSRAYQTIADNADLWTQLAKKRSGETELNPQISRKRSFIYFKSQDRGLNAALVTAVRNKDKRRPDVIAGEALTVYPDASKVVFSYDPESLNEWVGLNNEALDRVTHQVRHLRSFTIQSMKASQCEIILDKHLLELAAHHPELRSLRINGCSSLTASGIVRVLELLPSLQKLKLGGRDLLTKTVLEKIKKLPHLKRLGLDGGTRDLAKTDIESLKTLKPSLEIEDNILWRR